MSYGKLELFCLKPLTTRKKAKNKAINDKAYFIQKNIKYMFIPPLLKKNFLIKI